MVEATEKDKIVFRIDPSQINFVNRIIEGHDGLGILSTLDRKSGRVIVRVTPDTYDEVRIVLENLPVKVFFESWRETI